MALSYRNRSYISNRDPKFAEALDDVLKHISTVMVQTNTNPNGESAPPSNISSINVTAADGIFDIAITDNNSPVSRGINYFVEYSSSPQFNAPVVVDLGASRNYRGNWGNQTLYFRGYSAYPTSSRSSPVYFGSSIAPTAVVGGGSAGPAPLPSNGSGTSEGADGSDGGFGNDRTRGGRDLNL